MPLPLMMVGVILVQISDALGLSVYAGYYVAVQVSEQLKKYWLCRAIFLLLIKVVTLAHACHISYGSLCESFIKGTCINIGLKCKETSHLIT